MRRIIFILLSGIFLNGCTSTENGNNKTDVLISVPLEKTAILIPETPSNTDTYAAHELEKYLGKMTGLKPAIYKGDSNDIRKKGYVLSIGKTKLAAAHVKEFSEKHKKATLPEETEELNDSYIVDVTPEYAVLIGGSDRGTLYSVYGKFLDQ